MKCKADGVFWLGVIHIVYGVPGSCLFLFGQIRNTSTWPFAIPFLLAFLSGIGIIKKKEWARKLMAALCVLGAMNGGYICGVFALAIYSDESLSLLGLIVASVPFMYTLICALVFYYLTRPEVKQQFGNAISSEAIA